LLLNSLHQLVPLSLLALLVLLEALFLLSETLLSSPFLFLSRESLLFFLQLLSLINTFLHELVELSHVTFFTPCVCLALVGFILIYRRIVILIKLSLEPFVTDKSPLNHFALVVEELLSWILWPTALLWGLLLGLFLIVALDLHSLVCHGLLAS